MMNGDINNKCIPQNGHFFVVMGSTSDGIINESLLLDCVQLLQGYML